MPSHDTSIRRETMLWSLAGAAVTVPLALSTTVGRILDRRDRSRYPLTGRLVDVGGHRLHVREMGERVAGSPTVLFEAGLACPLDAWAWIQPEIAKQTATISYDRAGLGGSDDSPGPRSAARAIDELDAVLNAIDAEGPYVLVSHSYGGLIARAFADRHPDAVAGMVFADVAHPDQLDRSRRQRAGMPIMWAQMQQAATLARLGLNRIRGSYVMTGIGDLPTEDFARAKARLLTARGNTAGCAELDAWNDTVNDEVRATTLPTDCPIAVLTAGRVVDGDPVHRDLQAEIAQLSEDSTWDVIDEADHLGLVMNRAHAGHVIAAVRDVLVRAAQPVPA